MANPAIGPYAGLLLSDFGASVLRIDRPTSSKEPTPDLLTRRKSSLPVSLKQQKGAALFRQLVRNADVLIDPYRPGVLEKLGFAPEILLQLNPRLIIARLTGFRRDGPYKDMAGHDINYIGLAGALAMLGRKGDKPYAPGNLLADFAGGGLMCFAGILLALYQRTQSGRGQVVEANMVDGVAHLATFPRFAMNSILWGSPRGQNLLDGGCPWYDTYETKDALFVAVGCLEPQFYTAFLEGLGLSSNDIPPREDPSKWPQLRTIFSSRFRSRSRSEWEDIFDGTDACVTPILSYPELKERDFKIRPAVHLSQSPGFEVGSNDSSKSADLGRSDQKSQTSDADGGAYHGQGLIPGDRGENTLKEWMGWTKGKQYDIVDGGGVLLDNHIKSNL